MNAQEWIKEIEDQYIRLKAGELKSKDVAQLNRSVNNIISFAKLEIAYAKMRKELGGDAPEIPLLQNAPKPQ